MTETPEQPEQPEQRRPRRTMGPALLVAVAGGALLAVAGDRPWVSVEGAPEPTEGAGQQVATALDLAVVNPAVTALALVALAALGVVLVTRGRVRRAVAALALLAATGTAVAVAVAWLRTPDRVAAAVDGGPLADAGTSATPWAYVAVPAVLALLAACVVALRDVGRWPEMGRRYDAPTGGAEPREAAAATADPAERTSLDLWRAMDEGHDPTDERRR